MSTTTCPNDPTKECGGEVEYQWERGESGDGPWTTSWWSPAVDSKCSEGCELDNEQVEALERQLNEDGPVSIDD